ncbi:hypothetical protein EW146_g804 [Bondarzewia mesenterica]|uniref:DUF5745 domain-containing protein n=1 Tax=Bondarzewia mesenterica TaxID=1095465 RepID=A0A4S4M789_9AGAM|nr:hypothetical protein EW146_g804 [Bondarzewia mesenterica]
MQQELTFDYLVTSLNNLLASLDIPIVMDSPFDLTPSLLLAILESVLEARLPISQSVRESRDPAAKVEAMKIFLGVLENDVLGSDVGLSAVDPRCLAVGARDEVVFVGELLCWLGRKTGLLCAGDALQDEAPPERTMFTSAGSATGRMLIPSVHSTLTNSVDSSLSVEDTEAESNTTIVSTTSEVSQTTPHAATAPVHRRNGNCPRCIHEIEDPSFLAPTLMDSYDSESGTEENSSNLFAPEPSGSLCECHDGDLFSSTSRARQSVRYNGYIEEVDNELEVQEFETSRRRRQCQRLDGDSHLYNDIETLQDPTAISGKRILTRHTSPTQHTLALLNERARLLSELARLNP